MKGKQKAEEWKNENKGEEGPLKGFLNKRAQEVADQATEAVLGTLDKEGYPYTSVVEVMFDGDENFWLLLSKLATHTRNIRRDVRASLLIRDASETQDETLATTRASYLGRIIEMDHRREEVRDDYLTIHPHAKDFIKFSDFRFFRFRIERVRLIAGFGRMGWVDVDDMG